MVKYLNIHFILSLLEEYNNTNYKCDNLKNEMF